MKKKLLPRMQFYIWIKHFRLCLQRTQIISFWVTISKTKDKTYWKLNLSIIKCTITDPWYLGTQNLMNTKNTGRMSHHVVKSHCSHWSIKEFWAQQTWRKQNPFSVYPFTPVIVTNWPMRTQMMKNFVSGYCACPVLCAKISSMNIILVNFGIQSPEPN